MPRRHIPGHGNYATIEESAREILRLANVRPEEDQDYAVLARRILAVLEAEAAATSEPPSTTSEAT